MIYPQHNNAKQTLCILYGTYILKTKSCHVTNFVVTDRRAMIQYKDVALPV